MNKVLEGLELEATPTVTEIDADDNAGDADASGDGSAYTEDIFGFGYTDACVVDEEPLPDVKMKQPYAVMLGSLKKPKPVTSTILGMPRDDLVCMFSSHCSHIL